MAAAAVIAAPRPAAPAAGAAAPAAGSNFAPDGSYLGPVADITDGQTYHFSQYATHAKRFCYGDTKANQNGGQIVYVNLHKNARAPMAMQMCMIDQPLHAPFGLSKPGKHKKGKRKRGDKDAAPEEAEAPAIDDPKQAWNLDVNVDEPSALRSFLVDVDQRTIDVALARRAEFWKNVPKKNREEDAVVKAWYKPILKPPSEPEEGEPANEYGETLRMKVYREGDNRTLVYEKVGETRLPDGTVEWDIQERTWQHLQQKHLDIVPVVTWNGLWFMGNDFGHKLTARKVIYIKRTARAAQFVGFAVRQSPVGAAPPPPPGSFASPPPSAGPAGGAGGDAMPDPYSDAAVADPPASAGAASAIPPYV